MTKSIPWSGIVGGAGAGNDSGRYTAGEWWSVWGIQQNASGLVVPSVGASLRTLAELTNVGVYYDVENRLIVTDSGGFVAGVATGAALVEGALFYENTARALTMPANQTYYVVVRKNYSAVAYTPPGYAAGDGVVPAYTCRITWVAAIVQDITRVTYWDIPLATVVTDASQITSVTDTRQWVNTRMGVGIAAAGNTAIYDVLTLGVRVDDGVGAAGLGAAIRFRLENSAGAAEDAGQIAVRYTDPAAGDETRLELRLKAGGNDNLSAVINAPTAVSADGNARGTGAVDFQQTRTAVIEVASGSDSVVAGGHSNTASGMFGVTSGGYDNVASGTSSTVSGGQSNEATALNSHVGGGNQNVASGEASTVPGGSDNDAAGNYSFAAGRRAHTGADAGVFVWADSEDADFTADRANQFKVRASGSAEFTQNAPAAVLPVMKLTQMDQNETFIDFVGTTAADQTKSISTVNGDGTVDGPKNASIFSGWTFVGMIKVDVNGADFWMPYYQPDVP